MNNDIFQMYLVRAERFHARLEQWLFAETRLFESSVLVSERALSATALPEGRYSPVGEQQPWGKLWDSGYFQLKGEVPSSWAGSEIWLDLEMGGEILLYDKSYSPVAQLTNTCIQIQNFRKTLYPAQLKGRAGKLVFYAEVACNGFNDTVDCDIGVCRKLRYGKFNREVWNLLNDFRTLYYLLQSHQPTAPFAIPGGYHWDHKRAPGPMNHRALELCMTLNRAIDVFAESPANAPAARAVLSEELRRPAQSSEHATIAVGHAHLDCGYLWKLCETERKACRTFAGQLFNIGFYPGYIFGMSQPQVYEWVRRRMPRLFDAAKRAVKKGSWEVQGGMWVEADCMMPSGESLIRQYLHGKNYWKEHFGIDVKNTWLPDGFGFSGALPQIMKACGAPFLVSQKISWNEINEFPYHSFRWRGLDGSEATVHFLPEANYNAYLEPSTLRWGEDNFREAHLAPEFLTLFGSGDGGGGPKMEHIEAGIRDANLEDTPRLSFGRACDFFDRMAGYRDKLPVWEGEIPLELHRGTLTNQGRTKRWLRKLEQKTAALEMLLASGKADAWPRKEMDDIWKTLLLSQFHDIITGTSIREVMEVVENEFKRIDSQEERLLAAFGKACCRPDDNALVLLQTMNCPYERLIALPGSWRGHCVTDQEGTQLPVQEEADGLYLQKSLPPLSQTTIHRGRKLCRKAAVTAVACKVSPLVLENGLVRCEFNAEGVMLSLYDKRLRREMLGRAGANILSLHVDMPRLFEGWEVEYTDRGVAPEVVHAVGQPIVTIGPLRSTIQFSLAVGQSTITQTAILEATASRVDFATTVDWREDQRRLRVNFHVDNDAREAVGEVQHGFIQRPLNTNTSQEQAKFDYVAHRWFDLSDDRGGIACLNNGRYAHSAEHGLMQLTLLRAPKGPDVTQDHGLHTFTYSIFSHPGDFREGRVAEESYQLNREPVMLEGVCQAPELPFALDAAASGGVDVDAFKRAERSDDRILRLHEYNGRHATARLFVGKAKAFLCDALEWQEGTPIAADKDGYVELEFRPFEFKTIRLK